VTAEGPQLGEAEALTRGAEGAVTEVVACYDREADTLYLYLQATIEPDDVVTTLPVALARDGPGALLELDAAGRLVGLEVLHAASTLPPDLLRRLTPDQD
jgi:uncharacterized protein YuzE